MSTFIKLYSEIIEKQKAHIAFLWAEFNKECDEINNVTKKELQAVDGKDQSQQQKILAAEEVKLADALDNLKLKIKKGQAETRKELEKLNSTDENKTLANLEKEIGAS